MVIGLFLRLVLCQLELVWVARNIIEVQGVGIRHSPLATRHLPYVLPRMTEQRDTHNFRDNFL
jgi:hypothetical protein